MPTRMKTIGEVFLVVVCVLVSLVSTKSRLQTGQTIALSSISDWQNLHFFITVSPFLYKLLYVYIIHHNRIFVKTFFKDGRYEGKRKNKMSFLRIFNADRTGQKRGLQGVICAMQGSELQKNI